MAFSSSVESWRSTLERQRNGIPINFLLAWLQKESGGNPCATGFAGELHKDGFFKFEAGIGQQFYQSKSSTDLLDQVRNGIALRALRTPCGAVGTSNQQRVVRTLTDAEKAANVQAFLGDVERNRATTHQQLAAVGSPVNNEALEDFWKFVKLQHGLPAVPADFLGLAVRAGAVNSFDQFRRFMLGLTVAQIKAVNSRVADFAAAPSKKGLQSRLADSFANAEAVGRGSGAVSPVVAAPVKTTGSGAKTFGIVAGITGLVGLGWLALRVAKSAAERTGLGNRQFGAVDERLINRVSQALSYEVPISEIHDQLIDEGFSEEDVYLAYKAAKMRLRYMDEPPPAWVKPDPEGTSRRRRSYRLGRTRRWL